MFLCGQRRTLELNTSSNSSLEKSRDSRSRHSNDNINSSTEEEAKSSKATASKGKTNRRVPNVTHFGKDWHIVMGDICRDAQIVFSAFINQCLFLLLSRGGGDEWVCTPASALQCLLTLVFIFPSPDTQ